MKIVRIEQFFPCRRVRLAGESDVPPFGVGDDQQAGIGRESGKPLPCRPALGPVALEAGDLNLHRNGCRRHRGDDATTEVLGAGQTAGDALRVGVEAHHDLAFAPHDGGREPIGEMGGHVGRLRINGSVIVESSVVTNTAPAIIS